MTPDTTLTVLTTVAAVVSAAWGGFKGTEIYAAKVNGWKQIVINLSIAAVRSVYFAYVNKIKKENGKLTLDEAAKAREDARAIFRDGVKSLFPGTVPPVVNQYLTNDVLADSLIESAVNISKAEAAVQITPDYVKDWFKRHAKPATPSETP